MAMCITDVIIVNLSPVSGDWSLIDISRFVDIKSISFHFNDCFRWPLNMLTSWSHFLYSHTDNDPCAEGNSACQNGGTCTSDGLEYNCTCDFGFTGRNCETGEKTSLSICFMKNFLSNNHF